MFLINGHVVGKHGTLGKEKPWHGLAGDVHEAGHPEADRRLQSIEGRHQVVPEHDVRGISGRLGNSGRMHDGLGAPHDRERVAGVGEVGLKVIRLALPWPLEDRRRHVRSPHVVARLLQRGHRRRSDLAPRPCYQYLHVNLLMLLPRRPRGARRVRRPPFRRSRRTRG
jgi:hypothetical protein